MGFRKGNIFTPLENYTFKAYGECCSKTWIESFDNYEDLVGKVFTFSNSTKHQRNRKR